MKPLAIDLYCGLGGWTAGLIAEGYEVIGFDIEKHEYGDERYPGKLVLQDVLTLHGAQFKNAALIVASPPCQEFSYMAMPWKRGKQIARALRGQDVFPEGYKGSRTIADLTALFDACFRIQREASEAAGHTIPLVVENVKGAQPWVGRARWSFGSYFLWGDVPALMPKTLSAQKFKGEDAPSWEWWGGQTAGRKHVEGAKAPSGAHIRDGAPSTARLTNPVEGRKNPGFRFADSGKSFQREGVKGSEGYERNHPNALGWKIPLTSSKSLAARKAASAKIAKIPFALSSWIGRTYYPYATPSPSANSTTSSAYPGQSPDFTQST